MGHHPTAARSTSCWCKRRCCAPRARYKGRAAMVIDCDIHAATPPVDALFPYLSEHWREYIRTSAFKGAVDTAYPSGAPTTIAPDSEPLTSVEVARTKVLDAGDVELAIVNCSYGVDGLHNPD